MRKYSNVVLLIYIVVLSIILVGCVDNKQETARDNYKWYVSTIQKDMSELDICTQEFNTTFNKYKTSVEISGVDRKITIEELDQIQKLSNEMKTKKEKCTQQRDLIQLHLTDFKSFVIRNEQILTDSGTDTQQAITLITDMQYHLNISQQAIDKVI